jgi:hypothetical protein
MCQPTLVGKHQEQMPASKSAGRIVLQAGACHLPMYVKRPDYLMINVGQGNTVICVFVGHL